MIWIELFIIDRQVIPPVITSNESLINTEIQSNDIYQSILPVFSINPLVETNKCKYDTSNRGNSVSFKYYSNITSALKILFDLIIGYDFFK